MKIKETTIKTERKMRRLKRVRRKLLFQKKHPRLSVFRSNNHIYAQIIDDKSGTTVAYASEVGIEVKKPIERAFEVGKVIAKNAISKKVTEVVFDKGSYKYHGRVKALADGAREGGLKF